MENNILIVNRHFYPSYQSGGPVRSLVNLTAVLSKSYNIDLITSSSDLKNEDIVDFSKNQWMDSINNCNAIYTSTFFDTIKTLIKLDCSKYRLVYLNSFFDVRFSLLFLLFFSFVKEFKGSIVLAPRGELTHGAIRFKKTKKNLYLSLFKFLKLDKNIVFHFTSNEEMNESQFYIGANAKSILIPNMHEKTKDINSLDKVEGYAKVLFLSRISEKKNLLTALQALKYVRSDVTIDFTIVGPIDSDVYWELCQNEISKMPKNITIDYKGALDREEVEKEFKNHHALILPTYNENYGHAIVEAMIYGCIPVISGQTPWSLVSDFGGYVNKPDDIEAYTDSLNNIANLNQDKFNYNRNNINNYLCRILAKNELLVKGMFDNV